MTCRKRSDRPFLRLQKCGIYLWDAMMPWVEKSGSLQNKSHGFFSNGFINVYHLKEASPRSPMNSHPNSHGFSHHFHAAIATKKNPGSRPGSCKESPHGCAKPGWRQRGADFVFSREMRCRVSCSVTVYDSVCVKICVYMYILYTYT